MEINVLYTLAEDFLKVVDEVYTEYKDYIEVEPLPLFDSRFITVGAFGSFPAYKNCGQLTAYIGVPYAGLLNQSDAVTCGTPVSAGFTLELIRCSPVPQQTTKGAIVNQKFRDALEKSEKFQANDLILLRESALRFMTDNHATPNQHNNATVTIGQTEGGLKALTVSVTIPLLKKNRDIHNGG